MGGRSWQSAIPIPPADNHKAVNYHASCDFALIDALVVVCAGAACVANHKSGASTARCRGISYALRGACLSLTCSLRGRPEMRQEVGS